jgi:hypothetical protein
VNSTLALREVLGELSPRSVSVLVESPHGVLHIVPLPDGLWITEAGALARTVAQGLDDGAARAIAGEYGVEWVDGPSGRSSWVMRRVCSGESLSVVVLQVEAALDALAMSAQGCSLTSGDDERGITERMEL